MEERSVCTFVRFQIFLVLLFSAGTGYCQDHDHHHDHDHGHHHEKVVIEGPSPFVKTKTILFEKELEEIQRGVSKRSTITADGVTEIAELLLERVNCSGRIDESCRACAEKITDRIFDTLRIEIEGAGLDEESFNQASVVFLHTVTARNLRHECRNDSELQTIPDYTKSILATGGTTDVMTRTDLHSLLEGMTSYYQPTTYAECFDAESILNNPDAEVKEGDVEMVATVLLVKFLEGQCIGRPLEIGPSTFLEALVRIVSEDDYLDETELDDMMCRLSIGGDHSSHNHSHGGHDGHCHGGHGVQVHGGHDGHDHGSHDGHDHGDHDGHKHRRDVTRSVAQRLRKSIENGMTHHHDHAHHEVHNHSVVEIPEAGPIGILRKECFTAHQLFDIHGINRSFGISISDYPQICPSLLQQVLSGACQVSHDDGDGRVEATFEVWVYGMISVVVISCCSLFGGLILPCMSEDLYANVVNTLVALAVAVMSGDALIHLLPMALGLHVHDHQGHDHDSHDHGAFSSEMEYVWKSTAAMATVYLFFLFEVIVGFIAGHIHAHHDPIETKPRSKEVIELKNGIYAYDSGRTAEEITSDEVSPKSVTRDNHSSMTNGAYAYDSGRTAEGITSDEVTPTPVTGDQRIQVETAQVEKPSQTQKSLVCFGKGHLPIMIVIGDGLHNFGDGLAIGASFLAGIGPGISTSLAVFCHELPHELGDIAVLLKSGISLKWALFLNFLSALSCVAGLVVGVIIGVTLAVRQWIFAVTAGTFFYVALVDMLPHVIRVRDSKNPKLTFLLINIGFLCGMGIILLIALYEDSIVVQM